MADCVCSIVPDHVFDAIANSEHASAELKDHATRSLQHTKELRDARHSLEGLLHGGDENNHFDGGGVGGASGGGRYGHGGIFGEITGRYGHGGTYGGGGKDEPPADKDAQSESSHGKGTIIHSQMLDAISKSSAASAETKDAALRTKAHDEAAASTDQAGETEGATATTTTAAPQTASQELQDLKTAEAQGVTTDYDVVYPDSAYDAYDADAQTGYAGFYSQKSATASGGVQIADTYDPVAATQAKYKGLNRSIVNQYSGQQTPGVSMRTENSSAPKEPSVNRAFDGLGMTYKLLMDKFGRNSLDNKGKKLWGTVHYGSKWMNACWDGVQMRFGDGDGTVFCDFTKSIDVMAHEMTHAMISNSCQLVYQGQSGALNESCADVFGSMIKQLYYNKTAADADWLIGLGVVLCDKALRSLKAPGTAYNDKYLGKDIQPANMSAFLTTTKDNGGVHTNSGIQNKTFYNLATALGGYSWEKAGQICKNAQFADFAALTQAVASKDFDADTAAAVQKAWGDVGVVATQPAASGSSDAGTASGTSGAGTATAM